MSSTTSGFAALALAGFAFGSRSANAATGAASAAGALAFLRSGRCFESRFLGRLGGGLLRRLRSADQDLVDPHRGLVLAVAVAAARILAAALLECDDGLGAALNDHFRRHQSAIDERRAERDGVTLAMREHIADFHDVADFAGDLLDLQHIIGDDAILLAARFDDCEHFFAFRCSVGL